MSMLKVIYWSGTGNTKTMAQAVVNGAKKAGAEVELVDVSSIDAAQALKVDALALGCPAMGAEVLEEDEMEPFVAALESAGLGGKKLGLFGSYDWGDGEWMREWKERMEKAGATLIGEGVMAHNAPDADSLSSCESLGVALAKKA
ncbi:MAG: flavodoxin [Spirochaetia bacterium]|nr:flavodoxin [Spirochaetia bacterium]